MTASNEQPPVRASTARERSSRHETTSPESALADELRHVVRGEVRFDDLTRALYATDASMYQITPAGVVSPRDAADTAAALRACAARAVPIIPRGAGTGLAGGAVGSGVQLDFSRFMNGIGPIDVANRAVRVQAGVVLADLNRAAAEHGLHFAPDVATANRATIGGMIANNSCGAHSIRYGRTVDHVESLSVVLEDGTIVDFPKRAETPPTPAADRITRALGRIARAYRDEVAARFPKLMRNNGGYGLDRICHTNGHDRANDDVNPAQIICGSEGTLCVVTEAELRLTPLPKAKALLLVHFDGLDQALEATSVMLEHEPAAVELVDAMILTAAASDPIGVQASRLVDFGARALLLVEFFGDTESEAADRIANLDARLSAARVGRSRCALTVPADQATVWKMRERGLGLLMSSPGDRKSCAFVEDSAVDPARLPEYIRRFASILNQEGVEQVGYYAHASVGVIHVRPVLNLKTAAGVARLKRIADRVSSLALEFGGAMTGEHGDGIVRSCWLEKMYGPRIVRAFSEIKQAFDPRNLMNPGKIVDPIPMTEHLRFGPDYRASTPKTHLDFSRWGGVAGLAEMCSGLGECRKRAAGTMCPSFVATADERHTTRARANALRVALSNRRLLTDWTDPALDDVMDLCLACKACKSECPTGVDMARIKSEWLAAKHRRFGVSPKDRFIAHAARWARRGSRWPRLANTLLQSSPVRAWLERRYGLDRRVRPPRFAHQTFHDWFRRRNRSIVAPPHRPAVVYFADTWTRYYEPEIGIAAVTLLERFGFRVVAPEFECCGRALISKGLLAEAKLLAEQNIHHMQSFVEPNWPIVATEPGCLSTLLDEWPQLVRTPAARAVANRVKSIESFLLTLHPDPAALSPAAADLAKPVRYHGHCHEKALRTTSPSIRLMRAAGLTVHEIDSGCCGMAGSFGHEIEHYDVARAIGEERLFPDVRRHRSAQIVANGFSCRQQLAHHVGIAARHVVQVVCDTASPAPNV